MWIEVVAAALVGVSLLWLVFEPLFTPARPREVSALDLDALEEAEDTRSGVALTALKEIEFDRETGKLSDDDYAFLKQKYTVEALTALRSESDDADPDVEAQVAARVATIRAEGDGAAACAGCGAGVEPGTRFCPSCGTPVGRPRACANCGSDLPAGSRFCGACGGRVAA